MTVKYALGLSGRPRGVTKPRGHLLIECRKLGQLGGLGQKLFVIQCRLRQSRRLGTALIDQNKFLDARQLALEICEYSTQRFIEKYEPVLCMIDDVEQLVAREPKIDRVQNRTDGRDGKV